jgi:hypothetical protein
MYTPDIVRTAMTSHVLEALTVVRHVGYECRKQGEYILVSIPVTPEYDGNYRIFLWFVAHRRISLQ